MTVLIKNAGLLVFAALLFTGCMTAGKQNRADEKQNSVLFQTGFSESNLSGNWHQEGRGRVELSDGKLAMQDDGEGVVLWLRQDFPANLRLRFDLSFSNNRGIGVFFIAAKGTQGEDILTGLPERNGIYDQYIKGGINCYGVSLHRYFPDGKQNPGANIRKNSGFHLVSHAPDPILNADQTYGVEIEKSGNRLQVRVDGKPVHDWTDDESRGSVLKDGKIGLRIRGDPSCIMYIDNFCVTAL